MSSALRRERKTLARWAGWFFLINTLPTLAILLSYLRYLPNLNHVYDVSSGGMILAYSFLFLSFVAQAVIYNLICAAIVWLFILIFPRRWLAFIVAVILADILLFALILESIAYSVWHFHPLPIVMEMLSRGALLKTMGASSVELIFVAVLVGVDTELSLLLQK